jgi:hypothetical protein
MILPPFFGLLYKRSERDLEQLIQTYLTADVCTYTLPTPRINVTYLVSDILTYNQALPVINITYKTADVLSYTIPKKLCNISYLVCDVLTYELPPTVPDAIPFINIREKDSLGIVQWGEPFSGKSAIQNYFIQYRSMSDPSWVTYSLISPPVVSFTHSNNSNTEDIIIPGELGFNRSEYGGAIYNSQIENSWNGDTPANTVWNNDGWSNLNNYKSRGYVGLAQLLNYQIGNYIVGSELIMKHIPSDRYWKIKFNSWTRAGGGGGFSYTRQEIISQARTIRQPLLNNETYIFRIAAINAVGTGLFLESNSITPSGGTDNNCDLLFFANMDQSDRNQITDFSCRPKNIDTVTNNVTFDNGDGAFTNSWYYNGVLDTSESPSTYPHMRVSRGTDNWSISGNFTISLWIKPDSVNSNTNRTIISSASTSGAQNNWKLYHYNENIYFSVNNTNVLGATNLYIPTNTYTNIAICRSNNYLSIFVDGIEKYEIYYTQNINIQSDYLIIGANHDRNYNLNVGNGRGYTTEGFAGNIDEVVISKSCFYRGNFTPAAKSVIIDCTGC